MKQAFEVVHEEYLAHQTDPEWVGVACDDLPVVYHYGIEEHAKIYEEYLLVYYQIYNTIINHGMVYYVPVNYPEACYTMFVLLCSLTVMALIRSYISINMMHQEDILMQRRKDQEQVQAFIKRAKAPESLKADIEQFYATDTDGDRNNTEDLMHDMPYYMKVRHVGSHPLFVVIPKDDVIPKLSFLGIFTGNFSDLKISRDSTGRV